MYDNKTFLAIVPARSGSKGLPGKNIKNLHGRPLLAWSIEAGLQSKYIDKVILSTDSNEYADLGKLYGAEIPFIRPEYLASDNTSRYDVIQHAIESLSQDGEFYDYIVLLEPTSPLRTAMDIDLAIEQLFMTSEAEAIVGVSKLEMFHPAFLIKLQKNFLRFIDNKQESNVIRRQDLEDFYFYEGSLYISEVQKYLEKEFYHERTLGYIVPKWKSLEIDDEEDFVMVEAMMSYKGYIK